MSSNYKVLFNNSSFIVHEIPESAQDICNFSNKWTFKIKNEEKTISYDSDSYYPSTKTTVGIKLIRHLSKLSNNKFLILAKRTNQ